MTTAPPAIPSESRLDSAVVPALRGIAARALSRMYRPDARLFAFTERLERNSLALRGVSRRYSAIAIIGLEAARHSDPATRYDWWHLSSVLDELLRSGGESGNLGDAALIVWAACASGCDDRDRAWRRVLELRPEGEGHPVVEVSWALAAACVDHSYRLEALRERLARKLMDAFDPRSGLFHHVVGSRTARSRVACFADAMYPIHALAEYSRLTGDRQALDVARQCAKRLCDAQGAAGQWWWHYDCHTGRVIEGYPVYAIHQDSMAPMALRALSEAGGGDFSAPIARGLSWLQSAPELRGGSLIDARHGTVWRKVARRDHAKATRYLQTACTLIHPRLRVPGVDALFPPGVIDYEDRPYHWGWFLYAWR